MRKQKALKMAIASLIYDMTAEMSSHARIIDILKSDKILFPKQDLIAAELIYNLCRNNLIYYEDMFNSLEDSSDEIEL